MRPQNPYFIETAGGCHIGAILLEIAKYFKMLQKFSNISCRGAFPPKDIKYCSVEDRVHLMVNWFGPFHIFWSIPIEVLVETCL